MTHYLLTSDDIPLNESEQTSPASVNPLAPPPRTHPPPLYYLPAVLLPNQVAFLERRKQEVKEAAETEWQDWLTQRKEGYAEVDQLRARIEEEDRQQEMQRIQSEEPKTAIDKDEKMEEPADIAVTNGDKEQGKEASSAPLTKGQDEEMEKESDGEKEKEKERDSTKEGEVPVAADGDDAVEY